MRYDIDEKDFYDPSFIEASVKKQLYLLAVPIGTFSRVCIYDLFAIFDCLFIQRGTPAIPDRELNFKAAFSMATLIIFGLAVVFLSREYVRKLKTVSFRIVAMLISLLIVIASGAILGALLHMRLESIAADIIELYM